MKKIEQAMCSLKRMTLIQMHQHPLILILDNTQANVKCQFPCFLLVVGYFVNMHIETFLFSVF